jgi:hypothetical protein
LNTTHTEYSQEQANVLKNMGKALTQVKVGEGCAEDDNHTLPHGGDPQHVSVRETPDKEKEDSHVPKNPEHEIPENIVGCVLLNVHVCEYFGA